MKTYLFKQSSFLFLLLYLISFSVEAKKAEIEKSKTVSESYAVNSDHHLTIDNRFGEVKITTWDKNELSVNISITVNAKNDDKAEDLLDKINIDIEKGKTESEFKTILKNKKTTYESGKKGFEINYEVKMPKSNALTIEHQFGGFIINDIDGKVDAEIKFGSASIGNLSHPENELKFEFSDNVTIESLDKGILDAKFSKVKLTASTDLKVQSEFSTIDVDGIGNLDMVIKFGSADIDKVIDAKIQSNMSKLNIDELKGRADISPKYGSLTIDKISKDMTEIDIDGEFSPIDISFEEGSQFYLDAYTSMSGMSVPSHEWEKENKDGNSKSYKGVVGGSSSKKVTIRSSFGKVKVDF